MRIVSVQAGLWTLPLRAPFATARRTALEAENVRVRVQTDRPDVRGDGACAPVAYVTGETTQSALAALAAVGAEFEGESVERLRPLLSRAADALAEAPAARAGLEMALFDAWAKHWNLPLWQHLGGMTDTLTSDLTVPIVAPEAAGALAAAAVAEGFTALKIKVGDADGHEADLARVAAVAGAAPQARLRIDANQGFTPDGAVAFVRALKDHGTQIEILEQPVARDDFAGLKYVRERVNVPVFADESACSVADVLRLIREDAVDGINVKLMKSGLAGALEIITLCRAAGLKLMLGCMLESGLGIAAAAQMAGGTGAFDFLDLDSHRLLAPQPDVSGGFRCERDQILLEARAPGWGVALPRWDDGNKDATASD